MSIATLVSPPAVQLRPMAWRDLPQVIRLAGEGHVPAWTGTDLRTVLQSHETLGCVAEAHPHLAGFVLCTLVHPDTGSNVGLRESLKKLFGRLIGRWSRQPLFVQLLDVVVLPGWPRAEIEQGLLEQLDRDLRRAKGDLLLVVPETNLTAQLFLRQAGYRATRVLRAYYGSEDGYLMIRWNS
jgi:ribosomal protein S18 acetylase RimI-like enzyme